VTSAVHGLALGGGAELALTAHRVVATDRAAMGFPETGIGIAAVGLFYPYKLSAPWKMLTVEKRLQLLRRTDSTYSPPPWENGMNIVYEKMTNLIGSWAISSRSTQAIMFQMAVAELFDLDPSTYDHLRRHGPDPGIHEWDLAVANMNGAEGDWVRAATRAMYRATQDRLRAYGVTDLLLARGTAEDLAGEPSPTFHPKYGEDLPPGNHPQRLGPASAWSATEDVARHFGMRRVFRARVPANRILSTPRTGMGAIGEEEFIVIGGAGEVNVTYHPNVSGEMEAFFAVDNPTS
jgi:hypothetical protein